MTDKIIRVKIETGDSPQQINQLDNSMVKLGASTDRTTEEVAQLNTQMTKTAQGVSQATGKIGQVAQQAGFQIQDFANQVAGGQSALLAFGQQAPQFLGTFGPGGAVFGAIIAVSAAIGGVLVNAIKSAKEEAQELPGEVKKFAEEIGKKFANVDLSSRADLARVEIGKLNTEYEKTAEKLAAVTAELKDLDTFGPSSKFVKSGEQYTKAWSEANSEVKENTAKLDIIKQKLEQLNTISQTGLGTNSLDNLDESSKKAASATDTLTKSLQIQKIALEQGELQAKLYAAANYLELDSVSKLPPAIRDQIIQVYALEQAKKQQAEAQADLNKEITEQAKLDLQAIKDDAEKARRAEREKQRINERIANMRLETQTMAAESELQRAVMEGRFSAEDAQAAERFASKVLQATTEYQTLLDLANNDKERQLEAEAVFQERLAAIKQQYADQQDQITANSNYAQYQYAQQLQNIQMDTASNALSALSSFAKQGSGVQKALFLALKGIQAAQAYTSGLTAAMLARATIPYPYSEPIALAQITAGKVSAAAIMATGIAGTFSGGGGGSIGGGSIPSSASATMPTTPQAAATVNTLEIVGLTELKEELRNNEGMVSTRFVASILDKIDDANRLRGQA